VLTARKHVYAIRHPRKLPVRRGAQFLATFKVTYITRGTTTTTSWCCKEESFSRDFRPHCPRKCPSRERPIVTCRALDGCGRLTSIFYQCHIILRRFFLASKAVIIVFYFGGYKMCVYIHMYMCIISLTYDVLWHLYVQSQLHIFFFKFWSKRQRVKFYYKNKMH